MLHIVLIVLDSNYDNNNSIDYSNDDMSVGNMIETNVKSSDLPH